MVQTHVHAVDYYSVTGKNNTLIRATTWVSLNTVPLRSTKGARHKDHTWYDPLYRKRPEEANPQSEKVGEWLPRAGGVLRTWGEITNGY